MRVAKRKAARRPNGRRDDESCCPLPRCRLWCLCAPPMGGGGWSRKGATLRTLKTRAVCELVNEMGVLAGSGALVEDSRQGLKLTVSQADR